MRTASCWFITYLLYISPGDRVTYPKKSVVFNFSGADSVGPKSGYCRENQPVLGPVYMILSYTW